ncbi:MAG: hypothetical protein IH851_03895 [Armatimonadetes bacterium]|nr:hypothetical protein [Armatimonadota bacterium]
MLIALGGLLFLLVIGGAVRLLLRRRTEGAKPPLVHVEFWVYTNDKQRPDDKELMTRLVMENPHRKKGPPVGDKEGLTMNDARFHIGLAKRERNPYLFRPDIIADGESADLLEVAALVGETANAIRVQFVSEVPLKDRAYLQFVTHAADAVAGLCDAPAVYDVEAAKLTRADELYDKLEADNDATRFELQVRTVWEDTPDAGRAFTRGMAKAGLPDIEMVQVPLDHKTLARFLVESAARECWERGSMEPVEVEGFGEVFRVEFSERRPGLSSHRGWLSTMHAGRKRPIGEGA